MSKGSNHSIYRFDEFGLDAEKLVLYRRGQEVPLPPKVVKTLAVFVEDGEFGGNSGSGLQFFDSSRTHPLGHESPLTDHTSVSSRNTMPSSR